jgi:hydroxypyruvate isomerase
MELIANISLLFTEAPLPERFALARRAGFDAVEIQFPYAFEAEALKRAAGSVPIRLINVPVADETGAMGLATDAARQDAFAAALEQARLYATMLGAGRVNVLAGPPPQGQPAAATDAVLADNLRLAADRLGEAGILALVEAVNPVDVPGFWLDGLDKALAAIARVGHPNLRLQFDLYHMARTEPDLGAAIARAGPAIGHVQFADNPGRHEPGTGHIDFRAAFAALQAAGYDGPVSAEYRPSGRTEDGLGWMEEPPFTAGR